MIDKLLKLAQTLDLKGEYELSDKLFKIAQNTPDVVVLPSKQKQQGFKTDATPFGYLTDASKYGTSSLGYDIEGGQYDPYTSPFKGQGPDTPFKPDYVTPEEQQQYEETGNLAAMQARIDKSLDQQNLYLSKTLNIVNQLASSINKFKGAPNSVTDRYFKNVFNTEIGSGLKNELISRDPSTWDRIIKTFLGLVDNTLKARYNQIIKNSIGSNLSSALNNIKIQDMNRYNSIKTNPSVMQVAVDYNITL
jgi:hypothetical protein